MQGDITLPAIYGQDPETGRRVMPLREQLNLHGHQPLSPTLEDRLCHLAVTSKSYQCAAEVANRFGISTDDSQIQRLAQRMGARAKAQEEQRVSAAFDLRESREISREAERELKGERFSMVLMLDGTMLRSRGEAWGLKPSSIPGERVAWHELKAGLVIRIPEAAKAASKGSTGDPEARERKRYAEASKYYVASDGGPEVIGRKLYAEALRRGLERARSVYVIADGAVWIWRLAAEHFPGAVEELDFYHASEHLWALGRSLWEGDEEAVRAWVMPLLVGLKECGGEGLLSVLEGLLKEGDEKRSEGQREVLRRETGYFRSHAERLDYPKAKRDGMPLGSGAMESGCSQIQGRFKRPGQFWSRGGEGNLLALEMAWRNGDWSGLWTMPA